MRHLIPLAALPVLVVGCGPSGTGDSGAAEEDRSFSYPLDDLLRLSHVQAKGTHNSYHIEPEPRLALEWGYTHAPLDEQARDQGVRQFELDVHIDEDADDLTVFHVPIVDGVTTCATLGECLGDLRSWSLDNPAHLPVVVLIESKDDSDSTKFDGQLDLIDASIQGSWPREAILTPDDLRGDHASVREAVMTDGWPVLGDLRGKAIFGLLDRGSHRDEYSYDQTSLDGRLMFALCDDDRDCAAFFLRDDPFDYADDITALAQQGFLIRTRADAGSEEAWAGDTSRLDEALAVGAHFISTDYPGPTDGVDYFVDIPEGTPARCNPITAPVDCTSEDLENPEFMR